MRPCLRLWSSLLLFSTVLVSSLALQDHARAQGARESSGANTELTRMAGTIKSVREGSITLTTDAGREVIAQLSASTRILRVSAGQKDLKNASAIGPRDLQPGDRVLVRGQQSADGHSIAALALIVMKQADVLAKRERDREDWQKRGVGGLVSAVDADAGSITISTGGLGRSRTLIVHTNKETVLRRYPPGSVKFDDAQPAPMDQIKPGDQLWARGNRSEDGRQLSAEEVVSGTFRNIAGTITAVDLAANSLTVQDAIAKNTVVVKISPDSQMKKLPPEMAQRIAMRLKANGGEGNQGAGVRTARPSEAMPSTAARLPGGPAAMRGEHGNGAPDFQRLISHLPGSALTDLQKGEAVMIVATSRAANQDVTAITLLAGVEPILTAAPNRSASMLLAPWTLGSATTEPAEP